MVAAGPVTRRLVYRRQSPREKYVTVSAMYVKVLYFASTIGSAYFNLYGNNGLGFLDTVYSAQSTLCRKHNDYVCTVAMLSGN